MEANNMAAMREALVNIGNAAAWIAENCNDQQTAKYMNDIIAMAQAALTAPPRNCDIGTEQEQAERYSAFCSRFPKCIGCPCCGKIRYNHCQFVWAQMPFEEGGAK